MKHNKGHKKETNKGTKRTSKQKQQPMNKTNSNKMKTKRKHTTTTY